MAIPDDDTLTYEKIMATMKELATEFPCTFKTVRPSGPAISVLKGRNTGIEPMFQTHYIRNVVTNPCNEISIEEGNTIKMSNEVNTTPHSRRKNTDPYSGDRGKIRIDGRGLNGLADVSDLNVVITMEIPGIEKEQVKVRRIDDILRVSVIPEIDEYDVRTQRSNTRTLEYILDPLETVDAIELELGVLTIVTDRGADVEDYEID